LEVKKGVAPLRRQENGNCAREAERGGREREYGVMLL